MNLNELYQKILQRKFEKPNGSYVVSLFDEGLDRIVQKVGEEAVEVVISAKNSDKQKCIEEMADLWFHSLVLLAEKKISPDEIFDELERRNRSR